jgi:uncharacterized protein YdeI (YjbR/CyaY-like superfamily)
MKSRLSDQSTIREIYFPDRTSLRAWLSVNHDSHGSIWLVYDKKAKGTTEPTVRALSYDDIVEEALCFGWIDSVSGRVDDRRAKLYFSPRKPGSVWSALNKKRVAALSTAGLLQPAGIAKIEAAKADGSWTILDAAESLRVPRDLAAAFAKNARARKNYDAFPPGVQKNILTWITTAKRPETRVMRVAETVRLAAKNVRANNPRSAKEGDKADVKTRAKRPNPRRT